MNEVLIRRLGEQDLPQLQVLYQHLHADEPPLPPELAQSIWRDICADPRLIYLGAERAGRIVSTCTLSLIPNLTRGGRSYGLIENVVTLADMRQQGLGTAVLHEALRIAWQHDCYKVMLMTGSKRDATLRFYEQAGFVRGDKTGFVARPA